MPRRMILPVSILIITSQCLAQQSSSTWLYPADTALLDAARRGLNGDKPEFATVYKHGAFMGRGSILGCRELTQNILAIGPLGLAALAGREARKKFESMPAQESIVGARGAIGFMVVFFSKESSTRMEGALAQGDMFFRPEVLEEEEDVQRIGCRKNFVGFHAYDAEYTWEISRLFVFHFEQGKSQPDWSQPVKLILRRSDGKEEAFQFDLQRALQSEKHERRKSNDDAWPERRNQETKNGRGSQQVNGQAQLPSNSSAVTKSPDQNFGQTTLVTTVAVTSAPSGAEIYLDHNFVGDTPSTVNVPSGKHSISVKKQGFYRLGALLTHIWR